MVLPSLLVELGRFVRRKLHLQQEGFADQDEQNDGLGNADGVEHRIVNRSEEQDDPADDHSQTVSTMAAFCERI